MLYFAWVREAIGVSEEVVDPAGAATIGELLDRLSAAEPYTTAFSDRARLRAALDQQFVPLDAKLGTSRELAIFPPVTGG